MRKYLWIAAIALIASAVYFTSCERVPQEVMETIMPDAEQIEPPEMPPEMMEEMPEEMVEMPVDLVDVLIYTNRSYWITLEDAAMAAETTRNLVESEGFSVEITKDPAHVMEWMLGTTGDGNVNVIILYGVLPDLVYGAGNTQPDGSIAENWIETTDGDTILNHADYIAWNSDFEVGEVTGIVTTVDVGVNQHGGLQNLMDNPSISLRDNRNVTSPKTMVVTSDGMALAPSLVDFVSYRSVQLDQLQGEWFAEKVFASDTGNAEAACADPVILRDGDRGRIAIIHGTFEHAGLLNGEVAAEIIINALLAPPMVETTPEPPTETVVETPEETPPEMVEETPEETTDLHGGMVDIEDAMSTIGLRKIYWVSNSSGQPLYTSIIRNNPDGSDQETIVSRNAGITNTFYMKNFAVDSEGGKIYWNQAQQLGGGLWRANLDGTDIEHIVTTLVQNFTLDLEAGKIYWIVGVDNSTFDRDHLFHRSNLDGSGVEKFKTSAISGLLLPDLYAIAFDPIERKIYAGNYTKMFVINADDLDIKFSDMEFEWSTSYGEKTSLSVDTDDRKIYWVNPSGNNSGVYRVNFDGTNLEEVIDEYDITATFDFNTRKIYWAPNRTSSSDRYIVWQANLDGSETEGLFALPTPTAHIAVETGFIN